jgi:hypothetical protein
VFLHDRRNQTVRIKFQFVVKAHAHLISHKDAKTQS